MGRRSPTIKKKGEKIKAPGGGRPPKNYDQRIFEELCKIQCADSEIFAVLDGDRDSVHYWVERTYQLPYTDVKQKFLEGGKASIRRKQMRLADRNAAMAIWLGKQYLGQKDSQDENNSSDLIKNFSDLMKMITELKNS